MVDPGSADLVTLDLGSADTITSDPVPVVCGAAGPAAGSYGTGGAAARPDTSGAACDSAGGDVTSAPGSADTTAYVTSPLPFDMPAGFADRVAAACYSQFNRLPRRVRPQAGGEWTLLAGLVLTEPPHTDCRVVALGTGTRCLGRARLSQAGDSVSDSHAEVVARRAFRRFLIAELRRLYAGKSCCLRRGDASGVVLRDGVRVHFFSSHTPCGDCSIFPRAGEAECETGPPAKCARRTDELGESRALPGSETPLGATDRPNGPVLAAGDVHRTGAKPVPGESTDPRRPGAGYHVMGVLRTKPGRGEPTLSMSCSDKMAKWLRVGLQGALLSCFLPQPLVLSSVVIGLCPYGAAAMRRALKHRPYLLTDLVIAQAGLEFEFARSAVASRAAVCNVGDGQLGSSGSGANGVHLTPSPCSVAWSADCTRELEVSTHGVRQGVTKKARGTAAARVAICRREMVQEFVQLVKDVATEHLPGSLRGRVSELECLSYRQIKNMAECYMTRWKQIKADVFQNWTDKPPHLMDFKLD